MKKSLIFLFLSLFFLNISFADTYWANLKDGPTSIKEAKKFLSNVLKKRELESIEGIWYGKNLGTVLIYKSASAPRDTYKMYLIKLDSKVYTTKEIQDFQVFIGTWEATIFRMGDNEYVFFNRVWYPQSDGSIQFDTQEGVIKDIIFKNDQFISGFKYDFNKKAKDNGELDDEFSKVWPKNNFDLLIEKYFYHFIVSLVLILLFLYLNYLIKVKEKKVKEHNEIYKTKFKNWSELVYHREKLDEIQRKKDEKKRLLEEKKEEEKRLKEEKKEEAKQAREEKRREKIEKSSSVNDESFDDENLMSKVKRLKSLYKNGTLTKAEFEKAKNKLLK